MLLLENPLEPRKANMIFIDSKDKIENIYKPSIIPFEIFD